VVYLDDQGSAEATVEEMVDSGGTAIAVRADVTDELDVERLFRETIDVLGGVDIVVHADSRDTRIVNQQAAERVRDGGAIVLVGRSDPLPPVLKGELQAREILIIGPAAGSDSVSDIAYYVAAIDRWRLYVDDGGGTDAIRWHQ
jgi:3-oxoacyl-[acyl-carrier protein] reductase